MLTVAFDADDTLWHNEDLFQATHRALEGLLSRWADAQTVSDRLHEIQLSNMARFGYGPKSFSLSMIEAAIGISGGEVDAATVQAILAHGKALTDRPVELLDGVAEVLDGLSHHRLMLLTKGELNHQLAKTRQSGLADRFWRVEVVADKTAHVYTDVLDRNGIDVSEFVMVGNSLPSDVLPVLEIGGRAVHVPYHVTARLERWEADGADGNGAHGGSRLNSIRELPALLRSWGY